MARILRAGVAALIMTLAATSLQADVVHLSDGSRIVGTLEQLDRDTATLSGTFNGVLKVPRSSIVHIETQMPVFVEVNEGEYVSGRIESPAEEQVVVHPEAAPPLVVDLDEVDGLYREDPLIIERRARALQLAANANVGMTLTSGNSETENLYLDGQLVARNDRNRYTVSGKYSQEESRDVLVKRNWTSLLKYDYFVADKWFWFNSATFDNDRFADLELRTGLAAGFGYQFFDTEYAALSFEIGPSYVHENFYVADNSDYLGSRWALRYDQKLWWDLTYFLYNEGVLGLEDSEDLTTSTRTGVLLELTDRIIARVQTTIDWDRSPSEDADGTDFEHTLTVGYRF